MLRLNLDDPEIYSARHSTSAKGDQERISCCPKNIGKNKLKSQKPKRVTFDLTANQIFFVEKYIVPDFDTESSDDSTDYPECENYY
jgi:hypothetical protein